MLLTIFMTSYLIIPNSCIHSFVPEGLESGAGMLVVEGNIVIGAESVFILSEVMELNSEDFFYVTGANVWVESERGEEFHASEVTIGGSTKYVLQGADLDGDVSYKLCISVNNKRYESSLTKAVITPEVNRIFYEIEDDLFSVYVETLYNDDAKYFRWSYVEDWEIVSPYDHQYTYRYSGIGRVTDPKNSKYCWAKAKSSEIILADSELISGDKIVQKVTSILPQNTRLSEKYSITIYQNSISEEAYNYLRTMKKNSEELGSIFSPQPNEMRGNIVCIDDEDELVLGFISVSTQTTAIQFFYGDEIDFYKPKIACKVFDTDELIPRQFKDIPELINYYDIFSMEMGIITWTQKECIDCRRYGYTTNNKPLYWN